jgi:hypothetical protein
VGFHSVAAKSLNGFFDHWDGFNVDIINPAAPAASDVVMILGRPVKAPLGARKVHFEDHSFRAQDFKIPIDRCNTNLRKPFSHQVMEVFGRGV